MTGERKPYCCNAARNARNKITGWRIVGPDRRTLFFIERQSGSDVARRVAHGLCALEGIQTDTLCGMPEGGLASALSACEIIRNEFIAEPPYPFDVSPKAALRVLKTVQSKVRHAVAHRALMDDEEDE